MQAFALTSTWFVRETLWAIVITGTVLELSLVKQRLNLHEFSFVERSLNLLELALVRQKLSPASVFMYGYLFG